MAFTATAADNCPGVTYACVPPTGTDFGMGTNTVTCTATDASGNLISTLVSGVPDSVSNPSGNGLPDAWEMQFFGNLNHFVYFFAA